MGFPHYTDKEIYNLQTKCAGKSFKVRNITLMGLKEETVAKSKVGGIHAVQPQERYLNRELGCV
jgi:hypothetical protein